MADGRPQAAADQLRTAIGLWHGTAYADFAYEPFAAAESQRLMEQRVQATELRVDADLALARHATVVGELEGLVSEHPMRERFWAQLMTALYRCGRQADALAAYSRVRRALIEELGIEPGPDLRRLERLVLEQSSELDWQPSGTEWAAATATRDAPGSGGAPPTAHRSLGPVEVAASPAPLRLLPLVGRNGQLDRLLDVLGAARPGTMPQLVLVRGESGCGKTRLLGELTERVTGHGAIAVTGSAEREVSLPYGPFADMVRQLLDATGATTLERLGHLRGDLAWLLPELGPPPLVQGADLALARVRLFQAVLQLFAHAGSGEPLLVMIDDAHRIGPGIAGLLRGMLDRRWERAVVVILAARTEGGAFRARTDDSLVDLATRQGAVDIEVGRLTVEDITELLARVGDGRAGDEVRRAATGLADQTGGVPLLVRELLAAGRHLDEVAGVGSSSTAPVSVLVSRVIERRLQKVSAETLRLLQVASVIGRQFDLDVLAALSDTPPAVAADLLEEALDVGIIVEGREPDRFEFDHGLIREVAAMSVSANRQVRLHGRVAEVLSTRGAAVEAARHGLLGHAGISAERAGELAVHGADAALGSLDFDTAKTLCSEALAGPAEILGPGVRADLLLRLGQAESLSGHPQAAEAAWTSAADLARSAQDDVRLARIALGTDPQGRLVTTPSDLRWSLLSEAMARLGPQWSQLRLLVASEWLTEAVMPPRRDLSEEQVFEVVAAAVRLEDPYALAAAYDARHVLARTRNYAQRRQWSEEFRALAEELSDDKWLFHAYLACLIDSVVEADGPAADQYLDRLRETCAHYRAPRALWTFELAAASCARLKGEFEIAGEHVGAAGAIGDRYGIQDNAAALGAATFLDALHRGHLAAIRSVLEDFAAAAPGVPVWALGAGLGAAADGDAGAARLALGRGLASLEDSAEVLWLMAVCLAAELVGWVGAEETEVTRLLELLGPYAGRFAVLGTLSSELGPADRLLGLLWADLGDFERADAAFSAAIVACDRLGARPWELRTRTDWLIADRRAGRPSRPWWPGLEVELEDSGLGGSLQRLRLA